MAAKKTLLLSIATMLAAAAVPANVAFAQHPSLPSPSTLVNEFQPTPRAPGIAEPVASSPVAMNPVAMNPVAIEPALQLQAPILDSGGTDSVLEATPSQIPNLVVPTDTPTIASQPASPEASNSFPLNAFPSTGAGGFQEQNRMAPAPPIFIQPTARAFQPSQFQAPQFQTPQFQAPQFQAPQFQPQQFQTPQTSSFRAPTQLQTQLQTQVAPTPGHNERVNMNQDLSLSPPPQPGDALKEYLPNQPPAFSPTQYLPNYDPQVGHRSPYPVKRADVYPLDDGEKFDFETKKRDFPPFGDIIATGRFFYMAEALWAEPQFQGNTAIATEAPNFGESISNDFDSDFHPRFRAGFESKYGPGIELSYFNINSNSEIASFTSDGVVTGHTNAWVIGRNVWSRIVADDAGEVLTSQHSIDIESGTVTFFKELKFPVSRINGNFGFQYVSIAQQLNANVVSANGATVENLQAVTDMRAYGPRAIIEYYRPIGHTPMELMTSFGGSVLFGQRDQRVTNSQTGLQNRLGADEFLTIVDFLVAVQYTKTIGENRSWDSRFGFMNQTWIGGGSAVFPQGDFGLRGLTFGIGYNR